MTINNFQCKWFVLYIASIKVRCPLPICIWSRKSFPNIIPCEIRLSVFLCIIIILYLIADSTGKAFNIAKDSSSCFFHWIPASEIRISEFWCFHKTPALCIFFGSRWAFPASFNAFLFATHFTSLIFLLISLRQYLLATSLAILFFTLELILIVSKYPKVWLCL